MYSLRLTCSPGETEELSAQLWDAGTVGLEEVELADRTALIAAFPQRDDSLLQRFSSHSPEWHPEPETNWIEQTHRAWPPREVGARLFLAPPWRDEPTPPGRVRLIHNPGLASGTGEHPCTQLALAALEKSVRPRSSVVDIGTGSGLLAIAALRLGARSAIGLDPDETALNTARENFALNDLEPRLVAGTPECLSPAIADLTIANINGTVLLSILDDLLRITRRDGRLILTGFPDSELLSFRQLFPQAEVSIQSRWCCLTAKLS